MSMQPLSLDPTFLFRLGGGAGKAVHLPQLLGFHWSCELSPLLVRKAVPLTLRVQDTVLIPGKTVIVLLTDTFQQLSSI